MSLRAIEALPAGATSSSSEEEGKEANFEATLANLRMLTKYSITVRAVRFGSASGHAANDHNFEEGKNPLRHHHHHHHRKGAEVFVQTKSCKY